MGFLPSAVLSLEEPRMLKADSFELEAMLGDCALEVWKYGWFARTRGRCVSFLSHYPTFPASSTICKSFPRLKTRDFDISFEPSTTIEI